MGPMGAPVSGGIWSPQKAVIVPRAPVTASSCQDRGGLQGTARVVGGGGWLERWDRSGVERHGAQRQLPGRPVNVFVRMLTCLPGRRPANTNTGAEATVYKHTHTI